MHCPEQPHLHSYFPLFPQRTLLTYDRSFCLLTSVPVPALRMMSFQISISSSTAVHTYAPCVRRPSRSWAVSGRGKMRAFPSCPGPGLPVGQLAFTALRPTPPCFDRYCVGLLLIWGFFAQVGILPSPFLLLSPKQLCFCPSQTLCPDFHVGTFSSGIFVTHESSPLI